jgi:hypothetical protein
MKNSLNAFIVMTSLELSAPIIAQPIMPKEAQINLCVQNNAPKNSAVPSSNSQMIVNWFRNALSNNIDLFGGLEQESLSIKEQLGYFSAIVSQDDNCKNYANTLERSFEELLSYIRSVIQAKQNIAPQKYRYCNAYISLAADVYSFDSDTGRMNRVMSLPQNYRIEIITGPDMLKSYQGILYQQIRYHKDNGMSVGWIRQSAYAPNDPQCFFNPQEQQPRGVSDFGESDTNNR